MKTSIPRTLLTAIPALAAAGCTENPAPRPNVIFILMDDAGYGDFGCYGQQKIETPNIDALSELGIRFTDMYSAAPLSSPARCGLLTGRHAGHAQIRANDEMEWRGDVWNHEAMLRDSTLEGQAPLEAGTPTLGSVMQQAGYATAMIGKWGVGGPATEGTPNKMGFGTYYGCICQRQAHTYYPPFLWQNDRRVYLDNELLPPGTPLDAGADPYDPRSYDKYTQRTYSPDAMYDQVLEFVNANKERPFFLMWTTPIPHSPMQAPDADVQYYVRKFGDEQPIEGKGYFPDVMPTLCELAGVEPPATDGISFLPALEGRRQPQHEYLYWEFPGSKGWVAVRWGEWKGLLRRVKEGNDRFELFNLSDDPREEHDLAAQHPEIIDRMWQFVSASHTEPANPKFRMEVGRK